MSAAGPGPGEFVRWDEATRERLAELLPEALVVVPVGATEQHGPHLPTGTDALVVSVAAERAVRQAAAAGVARPLVLAPTIPVGASDHHLPRNGTLSLSVETLLAVLLDLARCVAVQGGRRLVLLNGHGGNVGACQAAAAAASTRHGLSVGYLDYWRVAPADSCPVPGHAGEFESSMVLALRPELVGERPARRRPQGSGGVADVEIHAERVWSEIDGYTDEPARADAAAGAARLDRTVAALAARLLHLAEAL